MTIQFVLPDEFVAAAKATITAINPANTVPTDADVLTYVVTALLTGLQGLFPSTVLAAQAANVAQVAALQATIKAATVAAMNITLVS